MADENWELQRLRILAVVAEGLGQYDTKRIDLIHDYRGGRAEHTSCKSSNSCRSVA